MYLLFYFTSPQQKTAKYVYSVLYKMCMIEDPQFRKCFMGFKLHIWMLWTQIQNTTKPVFVNIKKTFMRTIPNIFEWILDVKRWYTKRFFVLGETNQIGSNTVPVVKTTSKVVL